MTICVGFHEQTGETYVEIAPIGIGAENFPAVNAANETVLKQAGNIETKFAGHGETVVAECIMFIIRAEL
jgi:hypothetical protein